MSEEPFDPYRKWLGIPLAEQPPNHYRLLGVPLFEDDLDVIENAAVRQMTHVRSFQTGRHSALSQKLLTQLSAARLCLLTPERKLDYDEALRAATAVKQPATVPAEAAPLPPPPPPAPRAASPPVRTAPPPKPTPAAPVFAVKSEKSGGSTHRAPKKKSLAPVIGLLVGAVALGVAMVVIFVSSSTPVAEETAEAAPAKPKTPLEPVPAKAKQTDVSSRPQKTASGSPYDDGTPFRVGSEFKPGLSNLPPGEQAVRSFAALREALAHRNMDRAATEAAVLSSRGDLTAAQKAELDHLGVMKTYLGEFWQAVRKGLFSQLAPGDVFKSRLDTYELISRQGESIAYKLNDAEHEFLVRELPTKDAVAFASQGLDRDDAWGYIYCATFLHFDAAANPGAFRDRAARFWHLAAEAKHVRNAHRNEPLAMELQLTADERNTPLAENEEIEVLGPTKPRAGAKMVAKTADPPSTTTPDPLPKPMPEPTTPEVKPGVDPTELKAALTKLKTSYRTKIEAAKNDPDAATLLEGELERVADVEPNMVSKLAYYELAMEIAAKRSDPAAIERLADAASRKCETSKFAAVAAHLELCKPTADLQMEELVNVAARLCEEAAAAGDLKSAAALAEAGERNARRRRDFEKAKELENKADDWKKQLRSAK